MDDRTFDDDTALQWIESVENSKASLSDIDIYPTIRSWLSQSDMVNVLEIGSGQGICSDKIDTIHCKYTGVEPSPLMTERARKLYAGKNRRFVLGNAYALPFSDGAFDGCFSILVWHLLADLRLANQELSRVLKPGGHFLIITANPASYSAWKGFYKHYELHGNRLEGTMQLTEKHESHDVLFLHKECELLDSLRVSGLSVESTQTFRPFSKEKTDMLIAIAGRKLFS